MIGKIAGVVGYHAVDHVLVDTGGIGYMVYCSERTLAELPPEGHGVALYTDLLVREDLLQLIGFRTRAEREMHRLLITVQGVGAKASISILGSLGLDGVLQAINLGDWAAIKSAQGIGPRIAQRVVNELAGKTGGILSMSLESDFLPVGPVEDAVQEAENAAALEATPSASAFPSARAEALSALINLGYGQSEAVRSIAEAVRENKDARTETIIRDALRHLAPAG